MDALFIPLGKDMKKSAMCVALLATLGLSACGDGKDGGTGFGRQVLKHIAQRFDQAIVQGVALCRAAQTHHGDGALHLQ